MRFILMIIKEELNKIFVKKVNDIGWKLKKDIKNSWFEDKMGILSFMVVTMKLFSQNKNSTWTSSFL